MFRVIFFILISRIDHLEKVRRWKLFVVTDHHDLTGARDNAKRILWRNLTCFVDHEDAEVNPTRRKKLSYRKRAHKENWL